MQLNEPRAVNKHMHAVASVVGRLSNGGDYLDASAGLDNTAF